MLRKRRRISNNVDDDPMDGMANLSDAMLVLALGFLVFAVMALSTNPQLIQDATHSSQEVSTYDVLSDNITESGGMQDSGYSEVGKVYKDPYTGELVMVSG